MVEYFIQKKLFEFIVAIQVDHSHKTFLNTCVVLEKD